MNESLIMLLAGPGSAYGGNEFRGKLDDKCPTMDLVKYDSQYTHVCDVRHVNQRL